MITPNFLHSNYRHSRQMARSPAPAIIEGKQDPEFKPKQLYKKQILLEIDTYKALKQLTAYERNRLGTYRISGGLSET